MAAPNLFSGLNEFLAVARLGSFRAASARLAVTPAAVSLAIKALEQRLGTPLFVRTTRSVALTDAGVRLLARVDPAVDEIREACEDTVRSAREPSGTLRVTVPRIALGLAVLPVLPGFRAAYPAISLEIDVSDASVDLNAAGFDAGIRIGGFIELDMVTVPLTPDFQWRVVGSPGYFAARGRPESPRDLASHDCIGYRFPTAGHVYRWQFRRAGRPFSFEPAGTTVVNDHLTMVELARAGLGLAYTADPIARNALECEELVSVLDSWCPRTAGLQLYFPARSQHQPKLRAFIDFARQQLRPEGRPGGAQARSV